MVYYELEPRLYEHFCIAGLIGDCGAKQKTVTDIINNSVSNVLMSNSASCTATGNAQQTLKLSDVTAGGNLDIGGITQDASVTVNMNCLQSQGLSADQMKQIQNDLKTNVQQQSSGFQFQPSDQETINRSTTNITSNANLSSIANCVANAFTNQDLVLQNLSAKGNITIHDLAQTAVSSVTAKCVQDQLNKTADATTLQHTLDTAVSQESKGIDITSIFTSLFGAYASMGQAAIIGSVVCCIVVTLCCFYLFGGFGGASTPPPPPARIGGGVW